MANNSTKIAPKATQQRMRYTIDTKQSKLNFNVTHFGSPVNGEFGKFKGEIEFTPRSPSPRTIASEGVEGVEGILEGMAMSVNAEVEAGSFTMNSWAKDKMMRSQFFNVSKHPKVTFRSTGASDSQQARRKASSPLECTQAGMVKLIGVEKEVEFHVTLDAKKSTKDELHLKVKGEIVRSAFNFMAVAPSKAVGATIFCDFHIVARVSAKSAK